MILHFNHTHNEHWETTTVPVLLAVESAVASSTVVRKVFCDTFSLITAVTLYMKWTKHVVKISTKANYSLINTTHMQDYHIIKIIQYTVVTVCHCHLSRISPPTPRQQVASVSVCSSQGCQVFTSKEGQINPWKKPRQSQIIMAPKKAK